MNASRQYTFSERRRIAIAALALVTACAFGWFVRTPIEQATKDGYGQARHIPQDTEVGSSSIEPVPGNSSQPVNP